MEIRPNGTRFKNYDTWENIQDAPYDYEKQGILNKTMSSKIVKSKNKVLVIIKQYFEKSIVFLLKYIDTLKNFKNIHWKNR